MLGVGGVGLFCGRGHLQTREIKGNQGKTREIKGNQGKSREIKGNQGEIRNPGETRVSYVYEGMFMYGSVGSQGRTGGGDGVE